MNLNIRSHHNEDLNVSQVLLLKKFRPTLEPSINVKKFRPILEPSIDEEKFRPILDPSIDVKKI